MIMVLFFLGDFSFCLADSLNCRMAASATGSLPFSISSSEKKALFQSEEKEQKKQREAELVLNFKFKEVRRNDINTMCNKTFSNPPPSYWVLSFHSSQSGVQYPSYKETVEKLHLQTHALHTHILWKPRPSSQLLQYIATLW